MALKLTVVCQGHLAVLRSPENVFVLCSLRRLPAPGTLDLWVLFNSQHRACWEKQQSEWESQALGTRVSFGGASGALGLGVSPTVLKSRPLGGQ